MAKHNVDSYIQNIESLALLHKIIVKKGLGQYMACLRRISNDLDILDPDDNDFQKEIRDKIHRLYYKIA